VQVAQNRGAVIELFPNRQQARKWLAAWRDPPWT
jgi:hypothetical protein